MLSNIINPGQVAVGGDTFYAARSGVLTNGATETLHATTVPTIIDMMEIAGDTATAPQIIIERRKADGTHESVTFSNATGTGNAIVTPSEIVSNGIDIFTVKVYDADAGRYKLALNRPLYFSLGVRIIVRNQFGAASPNAGVRVFGRTF